MVIYHMNHQAEGTPAGLTREEQMASSSIGSLVVSMAFPAILAQLINILYSIIDRIYIGHMKGVGAAALTGVGVTFCITVFISAFSGFINSGAAPLAAIWLGKKNREHAEKILGNSVTFLVICTIVLMAFFYIFQRPLLYLFGASDATIGYAVSYISIYLIGTVFVELSLGLNAFIICQGQSKTAMYSVLIGAIANIILDPVFIFAFGLGVKGAAIATVISQALSAFWVVVKDPARLPEAGERYRLQHFFSGNFPVYHAGDRELYQHCVKSRFTGIWRRSVCRIHDGDAERYADIFCADRRVHTRDITCY